MFSPMERQSAWAERMLRLTESDAPIDWAKERQLVDLEIVAADVNYAAEAVERTKAADQQLEESELRADTELLVDGEQRITG